MSPARSMANSTSIHIARFGGDCGFGTLGICIAGGCGKCIGEIGTRPDCGGCGMTNGRAGSDGAAIIRVYSLGSDDEPAAGEGAFLGIENAWVALPSADGI